MSSVINCHNHSTSAPLTQSDNDDENEFDSSVNKPNESMMHKVKDVMSKFLHPSFLFPSSNDPNNSKRKRSTSVEEQQTAATTTNTTNAHTTRSRSKYERSSIRDEEPQITDDEDSNSRDVLSTEQDLTEIEQQQTKRRRTANYQHILSSKTTNGHHADGRTSSALTSTDSVRSLSDHHTTNTTPIHPRSSIEQNHNERINRLTTSKQRFNILPTYRGSPSNYDPSKSPLFSAGSRKPTETTTNLKSNEFSANYLLASGLVSRPQTSSLFSQQSPATLTHPTTANTSNRLINERQMFGINYSSINSRRLPYIERLRRRTLEDCIRLNRTVDSEPLSASIIEEHKSTTASPASKRTKVPDKECGIQCDIAIESNTKVQRIFPPVDIQNEVISVPINEKTDSPIQTNSSITIEKIQSPIPPISGITKPKVLGNITPFSWPKFARAQDEFAKKYPEKCSTNNVPTKSIVSSVIKRPNVNITPIVSQQTNTSTIPKMPIFPFSSSRPAESIWKCPSCTKEHPAQTATCSLCRGINSNYKKPSAIEPTKAIEKQPISSNTLPDIIIIEPSVPTPSTNQIIPTTTKENVLSISPAVTTSAFPSFGVTPTTSVPITTKENLTPITAPVTTIPLFGIATTKENPVTTTNAIVPLFGTAPITTTKENPVITTSSITPLFGTAPITTTKENPVTTTNAIVPLFGTAPITTTKENPVITTSSITPLFGTAPITTTKENPVTTISSITPLFGTAPIVSPPTTTQENSASTSGSHPLFGITPFVSPIIATTKENPVTTSASPVFSTTTTFDKTSTNSVNSPFQIGTPFQPFASTSSTSSTTTVTSSTVPSITTMTPTSLQAPTTTSFGPFSGIPIATTTTTITPIVSTVSSVQSSGFTLTPNTSAPSITTSTTTPSNLFNSSTVTPTPATTIGTSSFPTSSTTSTLTAPNNFSFTPPTATPAPSPFGTGGFNLTPASTTIVPSTAPFGFGTGSSPRPFASAATPSMNSTTTPSFGTTASFGTAPPFGTAASFGTTAPFGTTPASVDRPANSASSFVPSGTSNIPSSYGFGSTSNTIQTSTAPVVPTSGFSFAPPSSTAPVFGAGPSALSNTFNFGTPPALPTNNNLFQFTPTTSAPLANPFSTPISSDPAVDSSNPFSIGSNDSTSNQRPKLRARRQRP